MCSSLYVEGGTYPEDTHDSILEWISKHYVVFRLELELCFSDVLNSFFLLFIVITGPFILT